MLCPYAINTFIKYLNVTKVDDYWITTMKKFAVTRTDITLKNHHTWGCPVYGNNYGTLVFAES